MAIGLEGHAVDVDTVPPQHPALLAGGDVPDPHRAVRVFARRGQEGAIRAERQRRDPGGVAAQGVPLLARSGVPDLHEMILAGRGEARAVGAERHRRDRGVVAAERADRRARGRIPDADGGVLAGRGDPFAVGATGHARGGAVVPFSAAEVEQRAARVRIPHRHGPVPVRHGEPPAVGAERHSADAAGRSDEGQQAGVVLTFQVAPLPVPAVERTLIEQGLDPGHVARLPLPVGQGDVAEIELRLGLQAGLGLLEERPLGPPLRIHGDPALLRLGEGLGGGILAGHIGFFALLGLAATRPVDQHGADGQGHDRRDQQRGDPRDQRLVPPRPAAEPLDRGSR